LLVKRILLYNKYTSTGEAEMELKAAVRLIGVVEDVHGAQVRVGVDYGAVTVWAPQPGGNALDDQQFTEFMGYLQQAYEDPTRKAYAEEDAISDLSEAKVDEDSSREEFDRQGLNWMGQ
jgi:hypothetical protein